MASEPGSVPGASRLASAADVHRLAQEIREPRREHAVVCVSIPSWASEPTLDADALAKRLGDAAIVYVLPTGDLSWELADLLPPRLDVYGGAARIWWPFGDGEPDPYDHPLFFVYGPSEAADAFDRLLAAFAARGRLGHDAPAAGTDTRAVVTRVTSAGAELTLPGGHLAFAHASHLSSEPGFVPDDLVRPGQVVRVRVGNTTETSGRRLPVSLLPFEPDLKQRFNDQYRPGMVVVAVIDGLGDDHVTAEIFPGIRGVLATPGVGHELDEILHVRINRIDKPSGRIHLSLPGLDETVTVQPTASVLPDGPPWLPDQPATAPADQAQPRPTETVMSDDEAEPTPRPTDHDEAATTEAPTARDEIGQLETVIAEGREVQQQVTALFGDARRRLDAFRSEAAQIRRSLERDLIHARVDLLDLVGDELRQESATNDQALQEARRQVADLKAQLAAAEQDRRDLRDRLREQQQRTDEERRRTARARKDAQADRLRADRLEQQMHELVGTDEALFLGELYHAYLSSTTDADRAIYPWRDPALGPAFLDSLARIQGVSRERVVTVCAHVACGRAPTIPSLELHALRSGEAGGSPQRTRADGARAFRASLQAGTPAARRLHYWQLADGGIELANITYHDDYSIA